MRRRNYYNMDPRVITMKYACKCAETGKDLPVGSEAVYYPRSKELFHPDSKTAYDFRCMKADEAMGYSY